MMDNLHKTELEGVAELANAGARRAAAAFAQLVGEAIEASGAEVLAEGLAGSSARFDAGEAEGATGVFFEFEGCLDALVGILFPATESERLVRRIVGLETGTLDPTIVESALMEVGNILASHVASGIADALASRLLPSIPALASERAEAELGAWIGRVADADGPCIEARLVRTSGQCVGRLVIVPRLDDPLRSRESAIRPPDSFEPTR